LGRFVCVFLFWVVVFFVVGGGGGVLVGGGGGRNSFADWGVLCLIAGL